ncbi:LRAT domain - like 10, partial [Theobroma cacao]
LLQRGQLKTRGFEIEKKELKWDSHKPRLHLFGSPNLAITSIPQGPEGSTLTMAPFKGSGSSFMGSASSFMGSGSSSKEIESAPPCQKCGYKPQYCQGGIIKTCLDCFLDGRSSFEFYEYGVPTSYFNNKPRGTCSVSPSKPDHEVVERATDLLERKGFGEYNLIANNCEHFAVYCKTGLAYSQQVQAAGDAITQIAEPLGKGLLCTGAIFAVPAVCLAAKAITGAQRRP